MKGFRSRGGGGCGIELNSTAAEDGRDKAERPKQPLPLQQPPSQQLNLNSKERERHIDLQFDLEKCGNVNEEKLNFQKQQPPPPKGTRDDANTDKPG